jgi:hypothetical protein
MTLQLRPETERRLRQEAARRNQDADTLADLLIAAGLAGTAPMPVQNDAIADAPEDQLSPEETAASLESLDRAFADMEAGRTKPAEEVFAATRARLGL